jgi:hypothetical protein
MLTETVLTVSILQLPMSRDIATTGGLIALRVC